MNAAIYARYSSDNQSPRSIEDQVAICRAYAEREGIDVVAVYSDAAVSGFGRESRPDYLRLGADALARGRAWTIILVEDLSRLTRDLGELLRLYQRLRFQGVDIVGVSDGISTAAKSAELNLTLKGFVNSVYRRDLSEKTHRGMAATVERGESPGGRVYGYRTVRTGASTARAAAASRYEIEPAEAEIVRRIFAEHVAGRSLKAIASQLNTDGVPYPAKGTGKERLRAGWGTSTIGWVLRNERYLGRLAWNRTRFLSDPETGLRRPMRRPQAEWLTVEAPELRIVSDALWRASLERRRVMAARHGGESAAARLAAARVARSRYLLTGVLRCGHCGGRMTGTTTTRRKGGRTYQQGWYRCGFAVTRGPAVCRHLVAYRQELLEGALIDEFRRGTEEGADTIAAILNDGIAAYAKASATRPAELEAEGARLREQLRNLVRYLADGNESTSVRAELADLEARLRALDAELASFRAAPALAPVHPAFVRRRLRELLDLLGRDPQRVKAAIGEHLEGDLRIVPQPAAVGERVALLEGAVSRDGLLALFGQQAVARTIHCGGAIAQERAPYDPIPLRLEVRDVADRRRKISRH